MLADNGIHLIHGAEPRHEPTRATTSLKDEIRKLRAHHRPQQAHRYLPDNAPAATPCAEVGSTVNWILLEEAEGPL